MRVAIFTDSYVPQINGVVTQIRNLSGEFCRRGHEVLIVAPSHDHVFREKRAGNLTEFFLPSVALPTYPDYRISHFASPKILREMKKFNADVVHVQTPFGVGWMGIRMARKLHIPVVGTYHTLIPEFLDYLPIPLLKETNLAKILTWKYTNAFYNSCRLVTVPTVPMKHELERNGVKSEVVVLPNAIDFGRFNAFRKKSYKMNSHSLIYFGRIGFEKNIEVLLHCLKHLLWKDRKVSLTITGSGPAEKYLKGIVRDEKLEKHVHFHAPLKQDELARHVADHDIFVTASTIETQGLTVLEAMACGIPCVGADYLGIKESIHAGKNGFLFRPFDFIECGRKIERLLESEALRKKLGQNAIATARKYSVEAVADETEKLYKR
ncbi:Trehalose synthase [uncultured archaeon]|nr:Trehalose synthase [uncultured archaeon]